MQLVVEQLAELWFLEEILHDVETLVDRANILQGEYEPTAKHTASHRRHRTVDDIEQRRTILLHRSHQLQAADGKTVHAHELILLDARERRDMINLCMLGYLQVLHDGTTGDDTILQVLHTEALQGLGLEVSQELLHGSLLGENPVVQFEGAILGTEIFLEIILMRTIIKHLLSWKLPINFST